MIKKQYENRFITALCLLPFSKGSFSQQLGILALLWINKVTNDDYKVEVKQFP